MVAGAAGYAYMGPAGGAVAVAGNQAALIYIGGAGGYVPPAHVAALAAA